MNESLQGKYDGRYADRPVQAAPLDTHRWPRNRYEAVCFVGGSGDVLLDIGCGDGNVLRAIGSRYRHLIGTEMSPIRLERAHERLAAFDFEGIITRDERLEGIANGSVDRVISSDVIEHIIDVYAHISEIYRVLKAGGDLVINTPNIATINKRYQLLTGRFPSTSAGNEGLSDKHLYDGGHLHYFTYSSLAGLLRRSGFQICTKLGFGRYGKIHNAWPSLLSGSVQIHARKPLACPSQPPGAQQ